MRGVALVNLLHPDMPLLEVQNLRVDLRTHRGSATAVRDVGFALERGDTVGLIGESGCGKSMTALALMGLAPDNASVSGSVRLHGQELVGLPDRGWRALRGNRIAMIFQEPMTALNPVHRVGAQIAEPLRLHRACRPPRRASRPSPCWSAWASPTRRGAWTPTRTSSPAASASA
jgi:ABC-type glutathione transport system ATPase component